MHVTTTLELELITNHWVNATIRTFNFTVTITISISLYPGDRSRPGRSSPISPDSTINKYRVGLFKKQRTRFIHRPRFSWGDIAMRYCLCNDAYIFLLWSTTGLMPLQWCISFCYDLLRDYLRQRQDERQDTSTGVLRRGIQYRSNQYRSNQNRSNQYRFNPQPEQRNVKFFTEGW